MLLAALLLRRSELAAKAAVDSDVRLVPIRKITTHDLVFISTFFPLPKTFAPTLTLAEPGYSAIGIAPFTYHWAAGHEIAIYVDTNDAPANANLAKAVEDGIAAWKNIALLGDVRMKIVANFRDADVIVHHSLAPLLIDPDPCVRVPTGAGGYTFFCIGDDSVPLTLALRAA